MSHIIIIIIIIINIALLETPFCLLQSYQSDELGGVFGFINYYV